MNVAPRHLLPPHPGDAPMTQRVAHLSRAPANARQVRRRWLVAVGKRLLPVVALALLASVALWPELSGDNERARLSYRRGGAEPQSGQMRDATYHGVDQRNRPYTITASVARQVSPERIDLTDPKSDMSLESGNWLLAHAKQGVFLQHLGSLDLSGDVQLYRDDGTTVNTSVATIDLKQGAASGAAMTHVEGPFGTLDAQGFTLIDKGAAIQFSGPGRLVLNATRGPTAPPPADPASRP